MSPPETAIVLLAAGGSTRLGKPKQLLRYGERTLLRHAADQAVEAGAHVLVVIGAAAEDCRVALAGCPVTVAEHVRWEDGLSTSIRAGVQETLRQWPGVAGILVMACDQPHVDTELLSRLIDVGTSAPSAIAASGYADTLGIPAYFGIRHFDALAALEGDHGAKRLIESAGAEPVDFPLGAVDVDTADDYRRL